MKRLFIFLSFIGILLGIFPVTVQADDPDADKKGDYRLYFWYSYYNRNESISRGGGFTNREDIKPFIIKYGTQEITIEPKEDTRTIIQNGEQVQVTTYEFNDIIELDSDWINGKTITLLSIPAPEGYETCFSGQPVLKFGEGMYTDINTKLIDCMIPLRHAEEKVNVSAISMNVKYTDKKNTFSYTGKPVEPGVIVCHNTIPLTEGVDYTISYRNNVNAGTASVVVTGIGNYTGNTISGYFLISPGTAAGQNPGENITNNSNHNDNSDNLKKGSVFTKNQYHYKVTSINGRKGTASIAGSLSQNITSVSLPDKINVNGYTLTVTSIADGAFRNCKQLTSFKINASLTKIGKNAFNGCSKLRKITITGKKLKSVGKDAFKGIHKKAVIKVPKKKIKFYKKRLKKKGQSSTVKIK